METEVQIYEHSEFGKIRGLLIDGEPWFVAADVCRVLEFKNPSDILKRLDDDERRKIPESRVVVNPALNIGSAKREINIINEPGLYRLIFSSRKNEARDFQRWVYHEVLPSIRSYGIYSTLNIIEQFLKSANAAEVAQKCVYVLEMSNGTVKIGCTQNFSKRSRQIETGSGLTVVRYYYSENFCEKTARLIEWACHENFSSRRAEGEFFSVNFKTACDMVDVFTKNVHLLPLVMKLEREKVLASVIRFFADEKFF